MCGIAGLFTTQFISQPLHLVARAMAGAVCHRGPDDEGTWCDPDAGIGLSHRRLSILDLSPLGHQPMHSASGRYVISFNGEVYNFKDIRKEIDESSLKGGSDTEVMLAAFEAFGVEAALRRFNGMFAFGVWDAKERVLTLARDRLGVKPLFYLVGRGTVAFASELKSLLQFPLWEPEIDRDSLADYMQLGYIPCPYSIYRGVYKLTPGTSISFRRDDLPNFLDRFSAHPEQATHAPRRYWSALEVRDKGLVEPFRGTAEDALEELDELLTDSVRLRMISDVPVGAFLSGGIDSSLVVALMQKTASGPVQTFTIGFTEASYNEAEYSREVATALGTDHHELYVTPEEARGVIPKLPDLYDEPFADSSQIPTFLVAQLAKKSVTVSLSGDGGDEFFGGYPRYQWADKLWRFFSMVPLRGRVAGASVLLSIRPRVIERLLEFSKPVLPHSLHFHNPAAKVRKFASLVRLEKPEELYARLITFWDHPERLVYGASLREPLTFPPAPTFIDSMMYHDAVTYLPDDILVKVDRATMGVSLEGREPLLDYRVFEFAWRLPSEMKIRQGKGKWILRQLLERYVPRKLVERPKMGFSVPIGQWLRGPLREWAEELLDASRIDGEGFLSSREVREKWDEHLREAHNHEGLLWNVLMFEMWLARNSELRRTRPE